jgi:hypothetical protein
VTPLSRDQLQQPRGPNHQAYDAEGQNDGAVEADEVEPPLAPGGFGLRPQGPVDDQANDAKGEGQDRPGD